MYVNNNSCSTVPVQGFHRENRMSLEGFNQLLELLRPSITLNVVKSKTSSGLYSSNQHIYPELIHAIGLCWLAGGNLMDIRHVYGVSHPSVYAITKTFLDAVNSCTAFSMKFPITNKEKQTVMNGLLEKSEQQLFCGCIGGYRWIFKAYF